MKRSAVSLIVIILINTFSLAVSANSSYVKIDVKDASLSEILKTINRQTGIVISGETSNMTEKKSFKFEGKAEDALEMLLGRNYTWVYEKGSLSKVYLVKTGTAQTIIVNLAYGSGPEEIGAMDLGPGGGTIGPKGFSVDARSVYILDSLNSRIQVFDLKGKYLMTIPLKGGLAIENIVVRNGWIFLYSSGTRQLSQLDEKGDIVNTVTMKNIEYGSLRELRVTNNSVYAFACTAFGGCRDYLMANIKNGIIEGADPREMEAIIDGQKTSSGKIVRRTAFVAGERADFQIEKDKRISDFSIELDGLNYAQFLGEDSSGNLFVEADAGPERNGNIVVRVYKVRPDGRILGNYVIPDVSIRYGTHIYKTVDANGEIFQFVPAENKASLSMTPTKEPVN